MATHFSNIHERAIFKFQDYKILRLPKKIREEILDKYLVSAIVDFRPVCKVDLLYNPEDRTFIEDLDDECIEILALGTAYHWLSSEVINSELLKNYVSTREFQFFSGANLLKEARGLRAELKEEFYAKMARYSYLHSSLDTLKN